MPRYRELYVFEGADGVGKSELSGRFVRKLVDSGRKCMHLSFPGKEAGTLGEIVYGIHHDPKKYGIESINPISLQVLHISAHIDIICNRILPAMEDGYMVVLDRFWWSTVVYGLVDGVSRRSLDSMIKVELPVWGNLKPTAIFLVHRNKPLRSEPKHKWKRWCEEYELLAAKQKNIHPIHRINNGGSIEEALKRIFKIFLVSKCERAGR